MRIARLERMARVTSTQDVVRGWLSAGQPEVCVAVADEQTAGRGRLGRAWLAPPGRALLVSIGLRPAGLPLARAWRLPAVAALAMLEAASGLVGEAASRLALKWPNDLVLVQQDEVRKVGGVLAEVEAAGGSGPGSPEVASAVIGLGVNVDWRAADFPTELATTMTSLSEAAGRPVDRDDLLEAWLVRLVWRYGELLSGRFAVRAWAAAQVTTGAQLIVETQQGRLVGLGLGVDAESGALRVRVRATGEVRHVPAGDVVACRVQGPAGDV